MNRKIKYYGLLLCAAGLFACGGGESSSEPAPKAVGFAVESADSRAVVTDSKNDILSLGVFGYSTGTTEFNPSDANALPELLYNRRATRTKTGETLSAWVYEPLAYWPLDPAVKNTFFAYSPHVDDIESGVLEVSGEDEAGYPYLTYTVEEDADVSDLVDLLYSELNADVSNINSGYKDGMVKYTMNHAMTWIRFLIVPMEEEDENKQPETDGLYAITEFYFTGANLARTAQLNMGTGDWTVTASGPVTYSFDHLPAGDDNSPNTPQNIPVKGGPQFLGTTQNCLMIVPQDITLAANKTAVLISYWYDKDGQEPWEWTEYYRTLPFPDVMLKPGKVMTYIVKISVTGATITFDSENTIEEWLEDYTDREAEVF